MSPDQFQKFETNAQDYSMENFPFFDFVERFFNSNVLITSPFVINLPTRGLLAVETMHAIV